MESLRGKYRVQYQDDMHVGTNSAVLTQSFVAESLQRDESRGDDGLNAARGAVNALLISLAFWIALGFTLFGLF
jgi:hypothetical protein